MKRFTVDKNKQVAYIGNPFGSLGDSPSDVVFGFFARVLLLDEQILRRFQSDHLVFPEPL